MALIDYEKELNKEQLEAVTTTEGPLRIIAGAGSGKTRVLIYRACYLVEHGVNPANILLLTFTNKAANEMRSRAAKQLDSRCAAITACTFHSFCCLMLRQYALAAGLNPGFSIISSSECAEAIDLLRARLGYTKKKGFPPGRAIASKISTSINTGVPLSELLKDKGRIKFGTYQNEIYRITEEYRQYKEDRELLDFDDLLVRMDSLLRQNSAVRVDINRRFRYIMVDEYQDTNKLQESILYGLAGQTKNICVVGDDYQSIYAFRGADVSNILDFRSRYKDAKDVTLFRNYRSDQRILDLANHVMEDHAHEGIYKEMESGITSGKMPAYMDVCDENEQRDAVFCIIKDCITRGYKRQDIAILERNSFWSNSIEVELVSKGVPYVKAGGMRFMDKAHVQNLFAMLGYVANPHNEIALFRVLKLYPGIGDTYSQRIAASAAKYGMDALLDKTYEKRIFYKELEELYKTLVSWDDIPFHELLHKVEKYYQELETRVISHAEIKDEGARAVLLQAVEEAAAVDFETVNTMAEEYMSLNSFLDAMALEANPPASSDDALTISTIHSAKGLEFPVVIILGCADGLFPSVPGWNAGSKEDEEELRCFYVAMTRAKNELYLIAPESARIMGRFQPLAPSHYLDGEEMYLEETY